RDRASIARRGRKAPGAGRQSGPDTCDGRRHFRFRPRSLFDSYLSALTMQDRPLSGIRVLDLTQFLSGPFATQIFADLGADVIKLEPPQGDPVRAVPPYFVGADSVYYLCVNRNKRSIAIDMKTAEGCDLVKKLALS